VDVHQSVGQQSVLDKTAAPIITENSQPRDFFLLYFQTIPSVIVQETNRCKQQDTQARNKRNITYSQQISVKDLYAFVAVTGEIGHDHKPSRKRYWTKDEL
jgi:hypothetical protein